MIEKYYPVDYTDRYCVMLHDAEEMHSGELFHLIFGHFSKLGDFLSKLRNKMVKPLGLAEGGSFSQLIIEQNEYELVLGKRDKHLDFYALLKCHPMEENSQVVSITTLVKYNNWLGKVYFFFVCPFHRLLVKRQMKRVAVMWEKESAK